MQPSNAVIGVKGFQKMDLSERFWSKVDKNGPTPKHCPERGPCWLWTGGADKHGYGSIYHDGKSRRATHVAFFLQTGKYPELFVCHHCDNPACVRFSHFFEGDHSANALDARRKGRVLTPFELGCIPHNKLKTHCRAGHRFDEENTLWRENHTERVCRTCNRINQRRYALAREALKETQP